MLNVSNVHVPGGEGACSLVLTLGHRQPSSVEAHRIGLWLLASVLVHATVLALWPVPVLVTSADGGPLKVWFQQDKQSRASAGSEAGDPRGGSAAGADAQAPVNERRLTSSFAKLESTADLKEQDETAESEGAAAKTRRVDERTRESPRRSAAGAQQHPPAASKAIAALKLQNVSSSRPVKPSSSAGISTAPGAATSGEGKVVRERAQPTPDLDGDSGSSSSAAAPLRASANDSALAEALGAQLREAMRPHFYYPMLARRRGWQGVVKVGMRVHAGGRLDDIRVVESSGYKVLDRAALRTLGRVAAVAGALKWPGTRGLDLVLPVEYRLFDG